MKSMNPQGRGTQGRGTQGRGTADVTPRSDGWQASPVGRRAVLLSGAALPAGLLLSRTASASAFQSAPLARPPLSTRLTLPAPTGHLRIGTTIVHLVDKSRPDPWVPSQKFRELMIQIWYPARTVRGYPRVPYTTPATARFIEKQQLGNNAPALNLPITDGHLDAPVLPAQGGWPVVLYSPALGEERSETTAIVEDLVSRGYLAVTIDHVHDSGVVELPGGRLEASAVPDPTSAVTTKEINSRVADVRFILDQLAVINDGGNPDHEHKPLPRGLRGALDLEHIGMFGHSDGGSTTGHVLHVDARVKAGINLDGTLYTSQARASSDHALMLFGRQDLDPYEAKTWDIFDKHQRGPKLRLNLLKSGHGTFSDFTVLTPQIAAILGLPPSFYIGLQGTINGQRAMAIQRTYIGAFFDKYLRGHDSRLLNGPSPRFPEVRFSS